MARPPKATDKSAETLIEDAVINNPEKLGFPEALAIRRCRIGEPCGVVDLVLLPVTGPKRLVLIEAKAITAQDSASKVVGQLLMYYGGALMLGSDGIEHLRKFAEQHRVRATSTTRISPKALTGGRTPSGRAWAKLYRGEPLKPNDIQLFIALNGEPHRAFKPTLRVLSHHGLDIGYCVVRRGKIDYVELPVGG